MLDKSPVVHDRVWDLLQRMRDSVDHVGRFYGAGPLERPALERPLVDRNRRWVYASSRPAIYGGDDHQAFKDWIAPSAAKRIAGLLMGQTVPRYVHADVFRDKETAIPREKVGVLIEFEFENATPGRRIVELAMERIDELKQPATRTEPEVPRDPRIGISTPGSSGSGAGQGASGSPKQPKEPGKSLGMG